ncbi:related to guanine nucleotide-binding protein alpha-2 subunit [Serendipita indica DSM 11827]|uniref:Related to guanine nucleotide-binding protein alpha-2 subunit n=1 Tax=Serendipita indica (strain DSM 11827) TaxID=1109443 RepID=G4TPK8_SERID|nr:related to guanine nucleotide-binding protein alpha-2 subunit [Serendipita indica DSM 11827]
MGICASTSVEDEQTRQAEQVMREAKRTTQRQTKVLLLGTGDSGKSTILKQIRVINSVPFTPQEVETFRQIIFSNLVQSMGLILEIMDDEAFNIGCSDNLRQLFETVRGTPDIVDGQPYPKEYQSVLQAIWDDVGVQKAVTIGFKLALPDNLTYYFADLPRLFAHDYVPTEQDILYSRVRTSGIKETEFTAGKRQISVVDVGGQRSERRKWIHCFQDVTAVLFIVSLSGYDQSLVEDRQTNQMQDAMTVWESICSSPWFERTSFILFLNKEDIFKKRIAHSSIRRFFPDYDGKDDYKDGERYFKRRFLHLHNKGLQTLASTADSSTRPKIPSKVASTDARQMYSYITTATDTNVVRNVLGSVNDIILRNNLALSAIV